MQSIFVGALSFLLLSQILFLVYVSKREVFARYAEMKAADELMDWINANPNLYIGDVQYARDLVMKQIHAYEYFLKCSTCVKRDDAFIEFLYSLLDQHAPPPPPNKKKMIPKQPHKTGCFIFYDGC